MCQLGNYTEFKKFHEELKPKQPKNRLLIFLIALIILLIYILK